MNYRHFIKYCSNHFELLLQQHWWPGGLGIVLGIALISVVLANTHKQPHARAIVSVPVELMHDSENPTATARIKLDLPLPDLLEEAATESVNTAEAQPDFWHTVTVKRGDTLSSIFSQLEIHSAVHPIIALGRDTRMLKRIKPSEVLRVRTSSEGFEELFYEATRYEQLHVFKHANGFTAVLEPQPIENRQTMASGIIKSSLFETGQQAGMSDNMIMQLAAVFGWDIDFALDIREGDRFTVIYEEHFRDGEKLADGGIFAAEFVNQGKVFRALRYTNSKGITDHYSPDGRSMRKEFLRTPVNFSRISSRFNPRRKHPILNKIRAHKGVDYAAPRGTPIKAAGDGRVVSRGVKGGYGKTIMLRHGAKYTTLYGHMSRYARGTRVNRRVKQGQVIGYVGKTGLATGTHLHYEFRINGVHRNPLAIKFPKPEPLPKGEMMLFTTAVHDIVAQLDLYSRAQLAMHEAGH